MTALLILSCAATVILGFYVLYAGDWEDMHLKRAAVMLSTTISIFLTFLLLTKEQVNECETGTLMCATFHIYFLARNCGIMLFQYACGRDAIDYKKRDRRGRECQTVKALNRQAQH